LELAEWRAGAAEDCHALFEFTAAETNLDLSDDKEVNYYLVLDGISTSVPVKEIAFANGQIVIEESGISEDEPPDVSEPGFYNKNESDARYLLAAQNASLYFVDGDPTSFVTATRPAQAYDALGNLWLKTNAGTNDTGWEQRLGSPGQPTATAALYVTPGTEGFSFIIGNPNGAVTAQRPAMAYDADGKVWFKTNVGSNNTGWELRIG
jgi:hypothetical protein